MDVKEVLENTRPPRFSVGQTVWYWSGAINLSAVVAHILPMGKTFENGLILWGHHYLLECSSVDTYVALREEFGLHTKRHCRKILCGGNCEFDIDAEILRLQGEVENAQRLRSSAANHVREARDDIKRLRDQITELRKEQHSGKP